MVKLTKEQQKALKQVYDRRLLWGATGLTSESLLSICGWKFDWNPDNPDEWWWEHPKYGRHLRLSADTIAQIRGTYTRMSYLEFRRRVEPAYAGGGAVMIRWADMWLGIEKDGYTHS